MSDIEEKDKAAPEEDASEKKPKRWWQWFLVYPTLAIALLTAGPQWFDKVKDVYDEARGVAPEFELTRFMKRNDKCVRTPIDETVMSPSNAEIWAVICSETGDIFIKIKAPGGEEVYSGVFVDEVASRKEEGKGIFVTGSADRPAPLFSLAALPEMRDLLAAGAATRQTLPASRPGKREPSARLAQATVVLCQTFRKDGKIVRRLRVGRKCYDEVIDGKTGFVISKTEVDCDKPCPE